MKQGLGDVPKVEIKEENVGKFTRYCKRKGFNGVTTECIMMGKRSKNAGVRKMAVFAENARKWN